jgi:exodeoxyribonuclease VII small subunit
LAEPRFEEAIFELEQIVQNLNQPNIDLDEAINLYERGVRLAQRGRHLITHAENRVNQLRELLTQPEGGGGNAPRSEGRN